MWFREGREALEASSYCEYSREDVGAHKRVTAYLPNLSKTAHFSTPIEGENRPPFPRLQSRGPIEAKRSGSIGPKSWAFPRLQSRGPIEANPIYHSSFKKTDLQSLCISMQTPLLGNDHYKKIFKGSHNRKNTRG